MVRQPDHFLWCCCTEEQEGMEREKGVYWHVDDIRHVYHWQTLEDKGMTCVQMENVVWKKLPLVMLFTKKNCMQMVTFPLSLNQWVFFGFADRLRELICLQWFSFPSASPVADWEAEQKWHLMMCSAVDYMGDFGDALLKPILKWFFSLLNNWLHYLLTKAFPLNEVTI